MSQHKICVFMIVFLTVNISFGLEYNNRKNPNTDFIQNESRSNNNGDKRDFIAQELQTSNNAQNLQSVGSRDYASQFPPLGPGATTATTAGNPSNSGNPTRIPQSSSNTGKRDYVASNFPPLGPTGSTTATLSTAATTRSSQNGRRDYVASNFPPLGPTGSTTATLNTAATTRSSQNGRRDYVAPNFPAQRPQGNAGPSSGKVSGLINFFNSQDNTNAPQNMPSYSSISKGPNPNNQRPTTTSQLVTTSKPSSFSSIVAGSTVPLPAVTTGITTKPTARPTSPVLPSSIVNNQNMNQFGSSGNPSDAEIKTIGEELLRKDINNAARFITINYQEKTSAGSPEDKAPQPFLTVPSDVWNIPTIQKLIPLLDNYERDTLVNEYITPQERNEENAFMDAIMSTTVIRHLMNFLKDKGYVTPDPRQQRDFLKQMWFNMYSRGKGKISSSAFEHVFVSELKNGDVSGLHNWVYFAREELANRINYLGYLKKLEIEDKGAVAKIHFNQQGVDKPVNSLFIGTSPELEMAIYTLCFVTRADNDCNLKFSGNDVNVVTHTFRYRSKNYIGSAYPQI